jgi:hypothetical protein
MTTPTLLTTDQIETIRRKYVGDVWDPHPEWGKPGNAHVAATGAVGAASVYVTGLGSGSVRRGTRLRFAGRQDQYQAAEATTISSGGVATVSLSPLLNQAVSVNDIVDVEPYGASVFNRRYGRTFVSDIDLLDLAIQAQKEFGRKIATSPNPDETLLRAIALLVLRQMDLPGGEFEDAARASDPTGQGRVTLEKLGKKIKELEGYVATNVVGPVFLNVGK